MITWSNDYSVEFEGIDEQHKTLFSIIQEVDSEINSKTNDYKTLIDVINKLDSYVNEHLSYEEVLMQKYAYPDAERHISDHNTMRYKILSTNYDNIPESKEFYYDTYTYLVNWLVNHIMKTDKALGNFLAQKGVSLA